MKVAVIGIGNILMTDEGAGVRAVEKLRDSYVLPESVRIIDGGTMGLDLLPFIEDLDRVLFVDAVNVGQGPGTMVTLEGDDVPAFFNKKLSVHEIGLPDLLSSARLLDILPREVCLIGIQPKSIDLGLDLSPEIWDKMQELLDRIVSKLRDWNIPCALRFPPK